MVENAVSIDSALEKIFGPGIRVEKHRTVSGGDINIASILTLSNAGRVFVKENRAELVTMFSAAFHRVFIRDTTASGLWTPDIRNGEICTISIIC